MEPSVDSRVNEVQVVEFPSSYVRSISLSGLERTSPDLVLREFQGLEYLSEIDDVYTHLESAHDALMSLGAFEAVDIVLDESRDDRDRVAVTVVASERSMVGINAGTYVQGSEGTLEASCHLRNSLGRAETVTLSVEQGLTPANNTYSLGLSLPRVRRTPYHVDLRIQQNFTSKAKWASYVERLRGVSCSLTSNDGSRALSYELGWRTLSDPAMLASPAIVQHLGESMKSCAAFTLASQTTGTVLSVELGGLGTAGLVQYAKGTISGLWSRQLSKSVELVLTTGVGVILPTQGDINPCDKFYVGGVGPHGLRGFQTSGIGPVSPRRQKNNGEKDFLGGSFMCTALGALRFELPSPSLSAIGIQGQVFLQAGTLTESVLNGIKSTNWRATLGAGLVWPTNLGVLELNLCQVIKKSKDDSAKVGLQFGITPNELV
jgi:outer membrane protein insertion porin family